VAAALAIKNSSQDQSGSRNCSETREQRAGKGESLSNDYNEQNALTLNKANYKSEHAQPLDRKD
jgi:hypothetical protein